MSRSAVIVGSGLSGLVSGILLAKGGWEVTILEAHAIPGGLMQRYRRGGRWFDTGFHLVTDGGPEGTFQRMLRHLGVADAVTPLAPDPTAQIIASGPGLAPIRLPPGRTATAEALAERFPDQAAGIHRFLAALAARLDGNPWLAHLGVAGDPGPPDATVSETLDWAGVQGPAHEILGSLCSILAMRPAQTPMDLYSTFAGTALEGSWRLADGGDGLVRALRSRLTALGGRLLTATPASAILHDGHRAHAVRTAGGDLAADLVVTAIHPDRVLELTGPSGLRPGWRARVAEVPDSDGAVLLAAVLDRPAEIMGRSHHFLRLDDGGEAYAVAPDLWQPGLPPSLEAMVWVPVDAVSAWRESHLGRRPDDYAAWKDRQRQRLMAALEGRFPGIASTIQRTWIATPLTFRDYLGGRHGGAMGLSHDHGHLGDRPLGNRNKLRNLLMTGQSFGHPGILGTMIAAANTIGPVLGQVLHQEV